MHIDVLSDLLRSLRATGTVYFCDQLQAPWTKVFHNTTTGCFHQIRRGGCWVDFENTIEHLGPGDFIFFAPGKDHTLSSHAPGEQHVPSDAGTLLMCGYCEFTSDGNNSIANLFPPTCIIRDEVLQQQTWLQSILSQLSNEYQSQQPGALLAVNRLTEVLMVELIRMNFGLSKQSPMLQALADKHIAESLSLLHSDLSHAWSLDKLAKKVGLSRAGFAKKFKDLVGYSMFDYLTQQRIQRAKELLRDTSMPLYEVASNIGYESDLSFTRMFKKHTNMTPTHYRKNQKQSETIRNNRSKLNKPCPYRPGPYHTRIFISPSPDKQSPKTHTARLQHEL